GLATSWEEEHASRHVVGDSSSDRHCVCSIALIDSNCLSSQRCVTGESFSMPTYPAFERWVAPRAVRFANLALRGLQNQTGLVIAPSNLKGCTKSFSWATDIHDHSVGRWEFSWKVLPEFRVLIRTKNFSVDNDLLSFGDFRHFKPQGPTDAHTAYHNRTCFIFEGERKRRIECASSSLAAATEGNGRSLDVANCSLKGYDV